MAFRLRTRARAFTFQLHRRNISVSVEATPNPKSMKFVLEDSDVLGAGTKTMVFRSIYEAQQAPLARSLLKLEGIREVMLAAQHVTVTKANMADWGELQEIVEKEISRFFEAGHEPVMEGAAESLDPQDFEEGSLEARILELLEERVKPFVQQDGGDLEFERFDYSDSTLYLRMKGSCSGCAQSHATLQEGVKNLMDHYIPEVKQIVGLSDELEEDIPRPGR
eukprot:TRINITY_DN41222_c0_g1_i1.p1 TRINITY_DN41222_c0_g1~~TRINITY_DN41222_c0_g1_i1.p1  ORF type:complete len:222 (-),score=61.11 TRINITY_DN41222_c0_g1_i1:76-741(-)